MLSDEDSVVIKRFGILNNLISEKEAMIKHPETTLSFYGIPFPGSYALNESGEVTEKFFDKYYGQRHSASTILNSAMGEILLKSKAEYATTDDADVKVSAFFADEEITFTETTLLYVSVALAEGLHVYAEPLPDGFIPTVVTVQSQDGVNFGEPIYPETSPVEFPAMDVTLPIYEGEFLVRIPVALDFSKAGGMQGGQTILIEVAVSYQACNDEVCFVPKTATVTLEISTDKVSWPMLSMYEAMRN